MDENTKVIMSTAITILVPLAILYLQETLSRRKERQAQAAKQTRRYESIDKDMQTLKSTTDKISVVLDRVDSRLDIMGERIAHLEGKATQ